VGGDAGLLPALLALFQQFSLVSPLANAVAIPVVSFVVTPLALLAARSSRGGRSRRWRMPCSAG
jgi:predicted membrane metal-binding protein